MNYINKRLKQLREDYREYPEHRFKIELMAKVLNMKPYEEINIPEIEKPNQQFIDVKDALT